MKHASLRSFLSLASIVLLGAACASNGEEVDSPDLGQLSADEGLIAVRFLTQHAEEEGQAPVRDPDIEYTVRVGSSKSAFANQFNPLSDFGGFQVRGEKGPNLFLRKMEAGDHFLHEIVAFGGTAPIAVRFTVQPGKLTYIGDLEIVFIGEDGLFKNPTFNMSVRSDPAALQAELSRRHPGAPLAETRMMALEALSF